MSHLACAAFSVCRCFGEAEGDYCDPSVPARGKQEEAAAEPGAFGEEGSSSGGWAEFRQREGVLDQLPSGSGELGHTAAGGEGDSDRSSYKVLK